MILSPGQPIPHGRSYRYHLNGPVHMMTREEGLEPLPTSSLAVRHSTDTFFSEQSSEATSRFSFGSSSDSYSRTPNRRRSPMTSVPALSPVSGALSPVRADLIPSPKRVKDSGYLCNLEVRLLNEIDRMGSERAWLRFQLTPSIPVPRIQAIEGVQIEQGHRMVGVESAVIALTERIAELERDNMRLRGTMSVESQRVD
ncbi:hypothetical protein Tco_0276516 [Tanacetum coccineum]